MAEQGKKKEKPKYSIPSNIAFMVKRAWNGHKTVLWVCLGVALSIFGKSVTEMLIAPMILQVVENNGSIEQLIFRVVIFVLAIMFFSGTLEYLNVNALFGRVELQAQRRAS